MKRPFAIFAFTLVTTGAITLSAHADDLFSRVATGSVFSSSAEAAPATPDVETASPELVEKVLKISQLADLLRDAGLEPELNADETAATVKLQHARWTFPVVMGLSEDLERLSVVMLLSDLTTKKLPAERLLALLSANLDHQPAMFAYSEKQQRLELFLSIDNAGLSPKLLRDELSRLSTIAEQTAALWEIDPPAATAPAATTPTTAAPTTANPTTAPASTAPAASAPAAGSAAPSLVGKWSASRTDKEAFAIALNQDNTFVLVHIKDGKQNRSTGKYTLEGGQLTLTISAGGKLVATISNLTASTFDFAPQGGTAAKLSFKKA
jgi:uncharacterized protein (TIGR03066 family)